jgi:peptidoglycan/LPS O-acetylase OafA/YrhL
MSNENKFFKDEVLVGPTQYNAPIHLDYLDGLRAIAALYVLIHHAVIQKTPNAPLPYGVVLFNSLFDYGRYAVDLFIVISGFSLMLPIIRNNGVLHNGAITFFKRRARRILPAYYLSMAISLLLIATFIGKKTGTNWDNSIPIGSWDIITHLLLIQDFFYSTLYKINHVFWSISVETHIYLLFPILVLSWRRLGIIITILGGLFFALALWFALARTSLNEYGMSPHYLSLFTFGMLAAQVSFSKVAIWKVAVIATAVLLVISIHPIIKDDLVVGAISGCFIALVASGKLTKVTQWLSWKPLAFVGGFAYSIYLIHAPLLQIITQYIVIPLGLTHTIFIALFLLIGAPVIVAISYLFSLVAEKPFLTARSK